MAFRHTCLHPRQPAMCACCNIEHLQPLARPLDVAPHVPAINRHQLPSEGPAQLVITGLVRTMNPDAPTADAIAIRDGHIIGIGSRDDIEGMIDDETKLVDIGENVAYPGFVEPHMHYWGSALLEGWVDCSPLEGATFEDIVERLRSAGPTRENWTLGANYDPSLVPGEMELTRDILDELVPDRPVMVMNASMHWCYLNSRALELAGIDESTPLPEGGGIFVKENDRLTGAIGELGAMQMVLKSLPQMGQDEIVDAIAAISQRAAARGVTATHDALTGAVIGLSELDLIHQIGDRLSTRVSYALADAICDAAHEQGIRPGNGDDMVRAVSMKLVSDGSNQGRSGYQSENYLGRSFRGSPNFTADYMAGRIRVGEERGWQVMIHANGDAAIKLTVEAFEMGLDGGSGLEKRHRIEHCSFANDAALENMARLGLSPSFLMNHVYFWGRAFMDNIVGPEKAGHLDRMASALKAGLRPSLHSDYNVTPIDPLRAVQTAVTRKVQDGGKVLNSAECVPVEAALRAVTIDAAWQIHAEDRIGSLEVGKFADIVILDADPMTVDPDSIAQIGIVQTLLAGRQTYVR